MNHLKETIGQLTSRKIKDNLPMFSHIKHITGDVTITSAYTHGDSWSAIESISGYLHLEKDAHANLSALTSIGSSLHLEKYAHADLPALTSIGSSLTWKKDAHADLSALTSIDGGLTLKKEAHAELSALTSIGGGFNIDEYTDPLPTQLRHLETRENYKLIYQAEDIANQVTSSVDISAIKRRASLWRWIKWK